MRKLLLLVLLAAAAYWGYARYYANPASLGALPFPASIAWREIGSGPSGNDTVVASDGLKWRVEARTKAGKMWVAVFDGQKFTCTTPLASPEKVDPVKPLRMLLESLPRCRYVGLETVEGRSCWRFEGGTNGHPVTTWIDRRTKFPTRVSAALQDTDPLEERYQVLPIDVRRESNRLFDTKTAAPVFTSYFSTP